MAIRSNAQAIPFFSPSCRQAGALTTLVLQNSALALVMRYTRVSGKQASMYIPTTAVVMAEILKVVVALGMQLKVGKEGRGKILNHVARRIFLPLC